MAKKVQLMTNAKEWQTVNGVEVLVDVPQEDLDPITDSNCVEIEGHRTLEETISQENMFTPEIVETKVHSKVGGVYHDNVVDGAYEEAILYGNTQVNLVESVTTGTKYIPHSFTSFQGNESKIGNYNSGRTNQVAPLVKGVTMINLAQKTSVTIHEGHNGGAIKNVKPNTKYTLFLDFTVQNTQKGFSIHSFKDNTTYLETATVRTGMGEKVKFTFTTHEEANTIYIVNNTGFGGEIQLDNIMVIEGDVTDLNLPFFKGMRSVELSRPLTNLFTDDLDYRVTTNVVVTNSGGTITTTSQSITTWSCSAFYLNVKPNTEYLVMWDSLSYTHTDTTTQSTICVYGDSKNIAVINNTIKCSTLRSLTFNSAEYKTIELRFHATASNSETGVTTVTGLRVFEWDDSLHTLDLQTIGYFSGTKYVSARALETEGKNLYPYGDINFTNDYVGWCDAKGKTNIYGDIAQKSSTRFLLKKGTYTFSFGETTNTTYFALVDDKEQGYGSSANGERTFTLSQDTYMTLRLKTTEANVATTITNIQIERGETATTYEAYQSRYYKPRETEEIILRSLPNGVCDTFNLQTGELVQNIGEIVLDGVTGVQDWQLDGTNETTGISGFYLANSVTTYNFSIQRNEQYVISDKFKTISFEEWKNRDTEACVDNTGNIAFLISNSKLSEISGDGFKQYLQQNPITVQYKLKEPIITKLQTYDRIYNGQTNVLVSMGNNLSALSYIASNHYLKVSNLSPVPAIIEPITTISYDVRLKPSTLYTVKYNRGGNSNSMKFNLGGSVVEKTNSITDTTNIAEELTVRTPAILSHEQLILSGTGYAHNFIIVEGDITGTELPYFEGMKDVKMPIVKNIGKNLFDIQSIYQELKNIAPNNILLLNDNTLRIKSTNLWHEKDLGKPIKFKKNTRYTLSFNAQDINNIGGLPDTIICFVYTDGTTSFSRAWGDNVLISTAGKTVDYINFSFGYGYGARMAEFSNFMLVEGTEAQLYEPYKENSVYAVQGEIPFSEDMFEQGGFNGTNKKGQSYDNCKVSTNESIRIRTKDLILVKPNTQYIISNQTSPNLNHVFYCFDGNRNYLEKQAEVNASSFTTTDDCYYVSLMLSKNNNTNLSTTEFKQEQFRMYELDSTINLRSLPNGVKDELNLLTGEYIQRVGEVVLDGSDDEGWQFSQDFSSDTYHSYYVTTQTNIYHDKMGWINDKYVNFTDAKQLGTKIGFYMGSNYNNIAPFISTDKLTFNGFKDDLQQNPVTVQYELAEPIISHVRLVSNNQEREVGVKLPNGVCNTYNPSTGITTVRVGKVVLDGSEDWILFESETITSGLKYFRMPNPSMKPYDIQSYCNWVLSDSLPTVPYDDIYIHGTSKKAAISSVQSFGLGGIGALYIYYSEITTVEQLKTWLSQNPVTVWYELKYPQIQPDIVLPNGVHDEYNPETGVYTKKVGFIEFDGSEDWYGGLESGELQQAVNGSIDMYGVWTKEALPNARPASEAEYKIPGVCDTFSFKNAPLDQTNEEFYFISTSGRFNMNIARTKLTGSNVSHLKAYLPQNPIKLWYELQTPITYQLTPYFGLPQPYAYEDGYLVHESAYPETTLPPEFKYKLVANRTGQIVQNGRKLQEHTTRLSNLEALIIEATIESLFNRELQLFELELMDIQLIDLGE